MLGIRFFDESKQEEGNAYRKAHPEVVTVIGNVMHFEGNVINNVVDLIRTHGETIGAVSPDTFDLASPDQSMSPSCTPLIDS
jgi:hypothetical protein